MELFQGFDTFSGNTRNTVVTGTSSSGTPEEGEAHVRVCTDLEQLHKALQVDSSVSVSYGAFSADAKAKYMQELNLTTNSVVVVVYASKTTTKSFTNVSLPKKVTDLLTDQARVRDFVHLNGDSYVREITTGSEYFATFTFMSETENEKTEIITSLSAKGGFGDVKAEASMATDLSTAVNSAKVRYDIDHKIIGVHGVVPPTPGPSEEAIKDMIEFAIGFPALPADSAETVSFTLEPYEQLLPGSSVDYFSGVTQNRRVPRQPRGDGLGADDRSVERSEERLRDHHGYLQLLRGPPGQSPRRLVQPGAPRPYRPRRSRRNSAERPDKEGVVHYS